MCMWKGELYARAVITRQPSLNLSMYDTRERERNELAGGRRRSGESACATWWLVREKMPETCETERIYKARITDSDRGVSRVRLPPPHWRPRAPRSQQLRRCRAVRNVLDPEFTPDAPAPWAQKGPRPTRKATNRKSLSRKEGISLPPKQERVRMKVTCVVCPSFDCCVCVCVSLYSCGFLLAVCVACTYSLSLSLLCTVLLAYWEKRERGLCSFSRLSVH